MRRRGRLQSLPSRPRSWRRTVRGLWPRGSTAFRASPSACGSCWRRFAGSWRNHEHVTVTDRRTFLGALAGGLLALPLAAEAQPAGQVRRIGYLGYSVLGSDPSGIAGLRQGLNELDYVENKNIVIEYRFAEDRPDRLASLIAELIDLKVDVLITQGTVVTAAAKRATRETPIVSVSGDPVGSGFVQSLARPGGNITGLSLAQEESFGGKWLQLVRDAVPNASRVGIIWNPTNRSMAAAFKEINGTAPGLGIRLLSHPVQRPEDIDVAFAG